MRARRRAARTLLVVLAVALPTSVAGTSTAAVPDPSWIEHLQPQEVLSDFSARTILYNGMRFPTANGATQRSLGKFVAYGTVEPFTSPEGVILARVAESHSDDGVSWSEPAALTIKDEATGMDVPLIVEETDGMFAVQYGNYADIYDDLPALGPFGDPEHAAKANIQFALWYRSLGTPGEAGTSDLGDLRLAFSVDGVSFALDTPLADAGGVLGAGDSTTGPTQIFVNPSAGTCTAASAAFPFNCKIGMVYNVANGGAETIRYAGSNDTSYADDAVEFIGGPVVLDETLALGTASVSMGQVEFRPEGGVALYYSGADAPAGATGCYGGLTFCHHIGLATSLTGTAGSFTKVGTVIDRGLLELFSSDDPSTLRHPNPIVDTSNSGLVDQPFFFTRVTNAVERDLFVARRTMAPPSGPEILISNPVGCPQPAGEIDVIATLRDSIGTPAGIDMSTFSIDIDGGPVAYSATPSLKGAITAPTVQIRGEDALGALGVGDHTLTMSVADFNGNVAVESVDFCLDNLPPDTTIAGPATTVTIAVPLLTSVATYTGTTVDLDSPIQGVRAEVMNPLRQTRSYSFRFVEGQVSNPAGGFSNISVSEDGQEVTWRWIAPTLDVHFLLPGPYTFTFIGTDVNGNFEGPDSDNTGSVLVI